ncbi:MAG: hypothetical protein ABSF80_13360, partial [Chitinispirillaceae bacterium]
MRELKHEILARCARFFPGVCAAILALAPFCSGRASAEETMPLIRLVDMHTAGVIPKGYLAVESRLYEGLG